MFLVFTVLAFQTTSHRERLNEDVILDVLIVKPLPSCVSLKET